MKLENIKKAKDLELKYKHYVEEKVEFEKMLTKEMWTKLYSNICGIDTHFDEKYTKLLIKKEIGILDKLISKLEEEIRLID